MIFSCDIQNSHVKKIPSTVNEIPISRFDLEKALYCRSGNVRTTVVTSESQQRTISQFVIFEIRKAVAICGTNRQQREARLSLPAVWFERLTTTVRRVTLYSDSKSGQNPFFDELTVKYSRHTVLTVLKYSTNSRNTVISGEQRVWRVWLVPERPSLNEENRP